MVETGDDQDREDGDDNGVADDGGEAWVRGGTYPSLPKHFPVWRVRNSRRARALRTCRPLQAPLWLATCFITSALRGASFLTGDSAQWPMGMRLNPPRQSPRVDRQSQGRPMNNIIYIIGLIVVVLAILAFFGLR